MFTSPSDFIVLIFYIKLPMVYFIKRTHFIKHDKPTTEDIMVKLSLNNYICLVILIIFNKLKRIPLSDSCCYKNIKAATSKIAKVLKLIFSKSFKYDYI